LVKRYLSGYRREVLRDLSLHLLDILTNSISAGATIMNVEIVLDKANDRLKMTISDNGSGMSEDFLKKVTDPFSTTRTTRKVGLGLPLLKEMCELTGGSLLLQSALGTGTVVDADIVLSSIDRLPVGNTGESLAALISTYVDRDFTIRFLSIGEDESIIDTREIRSKLDGVPLSDPDVYLFLSQYIWEQQTNILGGI
jgi:signal transduction histidine kinase